MLEKLATHYGGQAVFELSTRITGMNHHALIYLSLVCVGGGGSGEVFAQYICVYACEQRLTSDILLRNSSFLFKDVFHF